MRSKMKGGGAVGFNMTPMIDIVFNLIIFFMLVAQFHQMKVEKVKLPPASKADPQTEELKKFTQLVINVVAPLKCPQCNGKGCATCDGTGTVDKITRIRVDGKTVVASEMGGEVPVWEPLITLLKDRKEETETKKMKPLNVILRADEEVPYETIGSVMLCASLAGIPYWWVQAERPPSRGGKEMKEYLGIPLRTAD